MGDFFFGFRRLPNLGFLPKFQKNGRDLTRKPEERFTVYILLGIGISSVPFFWELAPRFVDLVFYSGAGGGGWFWFQADVVTPSSSVSGACDFLFRLEGEVEGRVTKRPKKKPCLRGKKKNLPQTPK